MTYFPWSQDYCIGVRLIDNDHKELVELVNGLHDQIEASGTKAEIAAALGFLARYVKEHFAREEALLAEYGYPELAAHRAVHHKMTAKIHAAQKVFAADPAWLDPQKLLLFLREWLVHHILGTDKKYVPYLHGEAAGATAPPADAAQQDDALQEAVAVELEVPSDKVDVIRRCAQLLTAGGALAEEIEALAEPAAALTLEDAKKLIAPLLR